MKRILLCFAFASWTAAQVVPQVAFGTAGGGTWRTTILLAAQAGSATGTVQLVFTDQEGAPLQAPVNGVVASMHSVLVTAGGLTTVTVENDAGPLSQGWLRISPGTQTAVTGQAILRQRVAGRPDFEAVVPLSASPEAVRCLVPLPSAPAPRMEYPFNNSAGYATTLALVNLTSADRDFALEVFADDGNLMLSDSVRVKASGQIAFRLDVRFPTLIGRKGILRFRAGTSELAAIALVFNDSGPFTTLLPLT